MSRKVLIGSLFAAGVALLVAVAAAYVLVVPVDAANFSAVTGLDWTEFSSSNPEASSYLAREARVLAVGYLALGLTTSIVAWRALRIGRSWAVPVLYVFSLGMLAAAVVFFASEDLALGSTYLAAGLLSAGAVAATSRSITGKSGNE